MTSHPVSRIFSLLVGLLLTAAAAASVPSDVDDLVGARAAGGESQLQRRGYVHIETSKYGDRAYGQWWHPSRKVCLSVQTKDGRFQTITDAPAIDCNQHPHHTSDKDDDGVSGAALAVGAAAVIGAIALAHNSHHHDDDDNRKHYDDPYKEEEFERGYRDGLYAHAFRNRHDTKAYQKGYNSGVEQRAHDTSYRHHDGHDDHGYRKVRNRDFKSLAGMRREPANDRMRELGFRDAEDFTSGNTRYRIWYNRSTGQCIQGTYANDAVVSMDDIRSHPACR